MTMYGVNADGSLTPLEGVRLSTLTMDNNAPPGEPCSATHTIFRPVRLEYHCTLIAPHDGHDHEWAPR